jgi:hypothetical protein
MSSATYGMNLPKYNESEYINFLIANPTLIFVGEYRFTFKLSPREEMKKAAPLW